MAGGILRVIPEGELQKAEAKQALDAEKAAAISNDMSELASYVRTKWDVFRRFRTQALDLSGSDDLVSGGGRGSSLNDRLIAALRSYQGKYSAAKLAEIKRFGGSQVFAKITTVKCRGATALLKDIFTGGSRTWDLEPTPEPVVPDEVQGDIDQLVMMEAGHLQEAGQPIDEVQLSERKKQLQEAADKAALKQAALEARKATEKLDDYLVEGGFYSALAEFLIDLPIFYLACIKGPVVQMVKSLSWVNGEMVKTLIPKMFWQRVSPFDLYWTPGATSIEDAEVIQKVRYTRADLNALIGVPGYNEEVIREVLREYGNGYQETPDNFDVDRANLEARENIHINDSGLIEGLEFHGSVQGKSLIEHGVPPEQVPDEDLDYSVIVWLIGRFVIKAQINPNPRERSGYYITSFEKVPGSVAGNGVPDIIDDIQDVANASLRSLVNNMSISSGPQVAINEARLGPNCDADSMYPWKRWRFEDDPLGNPQPPITFFQPESNAQELMQVFQSMGVLADETSAIPRYMTGSNNVGGAAKTASGLSMLMNNSSKVLQNIAAQIDEDVIRPVIQDLYDFVMLTDDSGTLRGDENIVVKGVTTAVQKEQDRMRKLEFLQITGNAVDSQIVGPKGRSAILRDIADDLGMPGAEIVPSEAQLEAQQKAQQEMQQMAAMASQTPAPEGKAQRPAEELDNTMRTNI
jgi:hypothetical protein